MHPPSGESRQHLSAPESPPLKFLPARPQPIRSLLGVA
jgi:hypothetical protein